MYLIYVVDVWSLVRPVVVTLLHSIFRQWGQHYDDDTTTLPHHLDKRRKNNHVHPSDSDSSSTKMHLNWATKMRYILVSGWNWFLYLCAGGMNECHLCMWQMVNVGRRSGGCGGAGWCSLCCRNEITTSFALPLHFILSRSNASLGRHRGPLAAIRKTRRKCRFYDCYKNTMALTIH